MTQHTKELHSFTNTKSSTTCFIEYRRGRTRITATSQSHSKDCHTSQSMNEDYSDYNSRSMFGESDHQQYLLGPQRVAQHEAYVPRHPSNPPHWSIPQFADGRGLDTVAGKRERDSPVSDTTDGSWQSSFKRLKMMDDGASETYSTATNPSSHKSSPSYNHWVVPEERPSRAPAMSTTHLAPTIQRQVTVDSPEPPKAVGPPVPTESNYQSMNSLLGNLHRMRRQRGPSSTTQSQSQPQSQSTLHTPTQAIPHTSYPQPPFAARPRPVGAKKTSLRISSNLY